MENLKVYASYGEKKSLTSILVTDKNVYVQNRLMKDLMHNQVIINEILMMEIFEEYFLYRGYALEELIVPDESEQLRANAIVEAVGQNSMLFYKLWQKPFEYIDKLVMRKDGELFEMSANGRYTNSEIHREIVHKIVGAYFEKQWE